MQHKEFKDIKTYGEHVLKLLNDTHYCLRRNLFDTNKVALVQIRLQRPRMLYCYGNRVSLAKDSFISKHYTNN